MTIRFAFALGALIAQPLLSQATQQAAPPPTDIVKVAIDTSAGRILVAVDKGKAPKTAGNFLKYVDSERFNGESFYRAMPYGEGEGLIQGGITSDTRKLYPPIAHEPTTETGLKHVAGTLSVARAAPGTARADFFILTTDIPGFDADPSRSVEPAGYAAFGQVIEGMEVVRRIFTSPLSKTKGEGAMKGQMLDPVVKITSAARIN
ncbi:MAG TPA: peptidylprolyl isomerase [Sphingomicrobium sp.]|nr:peptidylprolyl isomerase [Sphingomicrobium sp.]